jgi:hypothetical protein
LQVHGGSLRTKQAGDGEGVEKVYSIDVVVVGIRIVGYIPHIHEGKGGVAAAVDSLCVLQVVCRVESPLVSGCWPEEGWTEPVVSAVALCPLPPLGPPCGSTLRTSLVKHLRVPPVETLAVDHPRKVCARVKRLAHVLLVEDAV